MSARRGTRARGVAATYVALAALALAPNAVAQRPRAEFAPLRVESPPAALAAPVTLALIDVPLADAVAAIARAAGIDVVFDRGLAGFERHVSVRERGVSAAAALTRALDGSALQAVVSPAGQVVIVARRAAAPPRAALGGSVRDSASGAPIVGARVALAGTRFEARTRADGAFSIGRVPLGDYDVHVAQIGYRPTVVPGVRVGEDGAPPMEVVLVRAPVPLSAVVVTPGHFGFMTPTIAARQTMTRQQIEAAPQIGEDIFRVMTRLPGVAGNDLTAGFHLRGAPQDEQYVSFDGLELVEPFHLKDLDNAVSIIDVKAVGGVEMTSSGFSAEYGDRLTGVLAIRSIEPRGDRTHVAAGISLTNVRASADGGFAGGRGAWLVSARRGYLDIALSFTDATNGYKPRYGDAFAKVRYDLPWGGRVTAHALYASDDTHFADPDSTDGSIDSRYRNTYAWLTWDDAIGPRLRQRTVASLSALSWRRGGNDYGANRQVNAHVEDRRRFDALGVRQDWSLDVAPWAVLRFGGEARAQSASYDVSNWRRDYIVDPSRTSVRLVVDSMATSAAPEGTRAGAYASARVRPVPGLVAELGVRHDRATHSGDRVTSPRANLAWEPRAGTTLRAAWGRYAQSQPIYALQAGDGVARFASAQRAVQRVLGVDQSLPWGLDARVEAYDRHVSSPWPRWVNAIDDVSAFPEAGFDRLRIAPTSARARGVELFASRDQGARADWSVSYALARSTDAIDGRDVPRAVDQRHTVRGDWSTHPLSNRWRLTVSGVWHSGSPATPQRVQLDTVQRPDHIEIWTRWVPGALNSVRLPAYRRVDVRWTRWFDTRKGRVSLFAEVFNLLGTDNQRSLFTNVEFSGTNATMRPGASSQVPRIPSLGFSWER